MKVADPSAAKSPPPEPAPHLSPRSQALWRSLVRYRADSIERQTLLAVALEDLDRVDEFRALLAKEGALQTSERSGLQRVHPAVRLEAAARGRFIRAWKTLGLVWPKSAAGW